MFTSTDFLKRHSLVIGIVLMFLYTWTIDLSNSDVLPFQVPFPIYITLGWGFIFASLLMTGLTLGKEGVIALLKRYLQWRVGWKWFLAAVLLEPFFIVGGVYLNAALLSTTPWGEWRFVEVEPLYFRQVDGQFSIVFREDDRGRITRMFTNITPMFALES